MESDTKVGARLGVPYEYYRKATEIFFEIGIKLIHVVWRKILPNDIVGADAAAIQMNYELLRKGRYALAQEILRFFCDVLPRHSNESNKRMMIVNYANSLNLQGDENAAKLILAKYDWSASDIKFRISVAAVRNEISGVIALMREIGTSGQITEEEFNEWPVFEKIRKDQEFLKAYNEIFGHDIADSAISTKINIQHISSILSSWGDHSIDKKLVEEVMTPGEAKAVSTSLEKLPSNIRAPGVPANHGNTGV